MNNLLKKMMMALLVFGLSQMAQADNVPHFQETLRAAEQGDAKAQFNLGGMYFNGRGVPQDNAQAAQWYRKAAEQGEALAQFNLGVMYADGRGVPQNMAIAKKWLSRACNNGFKKACNIKI